MTTVATVTSQLVLAALCACGSLASSTEARAQPTARPSPPGGGGKMETLTEETLAVCGEPGAAVVLAYVEKAQIAVPGSRGESVFLDLTVERTICGACPASVEAWRYTHGGDTLLQAGKRYVVVISPGRGPVRYGLGDFVPVPPGREAEAVDAHLAVLARMKPAKR